MSHSSRARKRATQRALRSAWDTDLKHSPYQIPVTLGVRTRSKSVCSGHAVIHRTHYREHKLRFVGFGVDISKEGLLGHGLRATMNFPAGTPITQYEGLTMTKANAELMRSGPDGKILSSHFASTSVRSIVINGYSVAHTELKDSVQGGVPLARVDWRGKGGGSLCNHSDQPNAILTRDMTGDGYGVYVIAREDIKAGQFIHVDYGKRFITSNKSNIGVVTKIRTLTER